MSFILALDQGTSSSRALLFDETGQIRGVEQEEFPQIFPAPGWVEHDAEQIWRSQLQVAERLLEKVGATSRDVAAIGITNQRETTVVWDRKTGAPIHNALVWQDRRTAEHCERLRAEGHAALIRQRTGLVIDAYFSATKVAWILEHVPGARDRAEAGELAFGTIDSWLTFRLTGGKQHVTDPSNASRTMLYDIQSGHWSPQLLELFGVPESMLPTVVPSSQVLGEATTGNLQGIPVAGIAGDQQAALFGQLCHRPGAAKNTYGTGCFLLMNTGENPVPSQSQLLTTVAWGLDDSRCYALEGSVFVGGSVVQWLRDGLGILKEASEVEDLARSVSSSEGVVFVPALTGLGAPHWDPHARGTILGVTRGTSRGHLARAALEGIAHQVADLVDAMNQDASFDLEELRVDGGAAANDLLLQTQADLLGRPVVRSQQLEATAAGAAYLAGRAVDVWTDFQELHSQADQRFEPETSDGERDSQRSRWQEAVARSQHWAAR